MKHQIKPDHYEIARFWLTCAGLLFLYWVIFWMGPFKLFQWLDLPYFLSHWWGVIGMHMIAIAAFHCLMVSISGPRKDE